MSTASGPAPLIAWYFSVEGADLHDRPVVAQARDAMSEALCESQSALKGITGTSTMQQAKDTFGETFFRTLGKALAARGIAAYMVIDALIANASGPHASVSRWFEHYAQRRAALSEQVKAELAGRGQSASEAQIADLVSARLAAEDAAH